jgi:hypothetical protein
MASGGSSGEWIPTDREVQVGATSQVSGLYDTMHLDKMVEDLGLDLLRRRGLHAVPARGGKGAAGDYDIALEWIILNAELFGAWVKILITAISLVPKAKSVLGARLKDAAQKSLRSHNPTVILWIFVSNKESVQTSFQMHPSSSIASLLALAEGIHSEMATELPHVRLGMEMSAPNRNNKRTKISFGYGKPTARLCAKLLRISDSGESLLLRVESRFLRQRRVKKFPLVTYQG